MTAGSNWRAGWERSRALLAGRVGLALFIAAVMGVYAAGYLRHELFPGESPPEARQGWWSWSDQYQYARTVAAIRQGALSAETMHYPPAYAALGALGAMIWATQPFFWPNLLLIGVAAWAWWRLAERLLPRWLAWGALASLVGWHRFVLADAVVVPWNTLGTQATLLAGIAWLLTRRGRLEVEVLACLAVLTYWLRPIDAVAFAPMLVWAVWRQEAWSARGWSAVRGVAIVAAGVVGAAMLNRAIFGEWRSPYEREAWKAAGFFSYPVTWKLYWLLVDGRPFFGESTPALLFRYPWLYVAVPGALLWVRKEGGAAVAALLTLGVNLLLYFNYNDLAPHGIYRFTLIHYLTWAMWLLGLLAVAALWHFRRERVVWLGSAIGLGLAVFCFGLRLEERLCPAPSPSREGGWELPEGRPLIVTFPALRMSRTEDLRLAGRPMRTIGDFLEPWEASQLRIMLSYRAEGRSLRLLSTTGGEVVPQLSELEWNWRAGSGRLKWFFK